MQIPGISDLIVWGKDAASVLRIIMEQAKLWLVKAMPYIMLPGILVGEAFGIFTSDEAWTALVEVLSILEGGVAGANAGLAPWLGRMNYVFPMTELFLVAVLLLNLAIACLAVRLLKAVIEFILDVIPF